MIILFCFQKLHQIEQLKEKQSRGEKLEANQVCAIECSVGYKSYVVVWFSQIRSHIASFRSLNQMKLSTGCS